MPKMEQPLAPPSYGESVGLNQPRPHQHQQQQQQQQHQQQSYPASSTSSRSSVVHPAWQAPGPSGQNSSASAPHVPTDTDQDNQHSSSTSSSFFRSGSTAKKEKREKERDPYQVQRDREREEQAERERELHQRNMKMQEYQHLASSSNARIPQEAQKALAPLTMTNANQDISGTYAIELNNTTSHATNGQQGSVLVSPTANVNATGKNDIDITLYFKVNNQSSNSRRNAPPLPSRQDPGYNIPIEVLLKARKGKLKLAIPERSYNRPLRVICNVEAANANVQLPVGFDGKLAIWTPQGSTELSEPLKANSTIIPSTTNSNYMTVYRITPSSDIPTMTDVQDATARRGAGAPVMMMDLCQINCSKGRVKVEYARAPRGGGSGCIVM